MKVKNSKLKLNLQPDRLANIINQCFKSKVVVFYKPGKGNFF